MAYALEIGYWAHSSGVQAPGGIKKVRASRKSLIFKKNKTEDGEAFYVQVALPLEDGEEKALEALLLILDPLGGSLAVQAIEVIIEEAFLAGIEFARRT